MRIKIDNENMKVKNTSADIMSILLIILGSTASGCIEKDFFQCTVFFVAAIIFIVIKYFKIA
jgi:uncharacterized membrane protein YoaK (UPF0700 family)